MKQKKIEIINNSNMITINHQFLNKSFFIPTWECKTLVLGTFNPEYGKKVNYFYGRCENHFWKTISLIENQVEQYYHSIITLNCDKHFTLMREKKFGCIDIICSVQCKESDKESICGEGFRDKNLFKKSIEKVYNFENIKDYINKYNTVTKIINTVGDRFTKPKPNEFKKKLNDFKNFCEKKKINFIDCHSASAHAVNTGKTKEEDLCKLYKEHLF